MPLSPGRLPARPCQGCGRGSGCGVQARAGPELCPPHPVSVCRVSDLLTWQGGPGRRGEQGLREPGAWAPGRAPFASDRGRSFGFTERRDPVCVIVDVLTGRVSHVRPAPFPQRQSVVCWHRAMCPGGSRAWPPVPGTSLLEGAGVCFGPEGISVGRDLGFSRWNLHRLCAVLGRSPNFFCVCLLNTRSGNHVASFLGLGEGEAKDRCRALSTHSLRPLSSLQKLSLALLFGQ